MELKELDRKTRKLMTMYGANHPKADVYRLYMKRSNGGRGLIGLEDCVMIEIDSLEKYLSVSDEKALKGVCQCGAVENKKNKKNKEEVKNDHEGRYKSKGLQVM